MGANALTHRIHHPLTHPPHHHPTRKTVANMTNSKFDQTLNAKGHSGQVVFDYHKKVGAGVLVWCDMVWCDMVVWRPSRILSLSFATLHTIPCLPTTTAATTTTATGTTNYHRR